MGYCSRVDSNNFLYKVEQVGYAGEMFELTAEEIEQICLIKAGSLREFSTQLLTQSPGRLETVVQPERVRWQDKFYATA